MKNYLPHKGLKIAIIINSVGALVTLAAGLALESVKFQLVTMTPLLIALPAMNAMASDYATIITAHIGDPEAGKNAQRKLAVALLSSVPVSIIGVLFISIFISTVRGDEFDQALTLRYAVFISAALISVVLTAYTSTIIISNKLSKRQINIEDFLITGNNILATVIMLGWFAVAAWIIF